MDAAVPRVSLDMVVGDRRVAGAAIVADALEDHQGSGATGEDERGWIPDAPLSADWGFPDVVQATRFKVGVTVTTTPVTGAAPPRAAETSEGD